jgi:hypothetical protein
MTTTDSPADASIAPYQLVPWKQAIANLDSNSNSLLKLCAENHVGIVVLSPRKRALLAIDLLRLVKAKTKPAASYAAANKVAGHG